MNDKNIESQELVPKSILDKIILFCLENKLVVSMIVAAIILWGIMVAPFDWDIGGIPRSPIPVDAIPDIGENQQIVFTAWMGRSPQDMEDQVTYPLTVAMLGIPGVKTVRSYSNFGFSMIFIIFKDDVEFYWSRSRVLEKMNSLPADTLPKGVRPSLGPDATALGQVYWYTLEGMDEQGNPTGGWDLSELRTIQDWYVRYSLLSAEGISDVASIGGFVKEYQVDVDPDAMRAYGVTLKDVFMAVKMSNIDVGAKTIEVNKVEYIIRGLGFVQKVQDIEKAVVKVKDNVPILIKNIGHVSLGPALRRGALDKGGVEAVGGVVVVRYGENPLSSIKNLKKKISEVAPGLPTKAVIDYTQVSLKEVNAFALEHGFKAFVNDKLNQNEWLTFLRKTNFNQRPKWVKLSQVKIVPFYDRTGLIYETLGTLNTALVEEILITIIVVIVMLMHMRSSFVVSVTLPLAVLLCFIAMKVFKVDANIVALSGIAIAIGAIVDMGVIVCENILKHLETADPKQNRLHIVYHATSEVASAVLTAILTTIISFLPVFVMIGAEGKLFKPLAFTKTFALLASVIVALTIVPAMAHTLFGFNITSKKLKKATLFALIIVGVVLAVYGFWLLGGVAVAVALYHLTQNRIGERYKKWLFIAFNFAMVLVVGVFLTKYWLPLGPGAGFIKNFMVVAFPIAGLLLFFWLFMKAYAPLLRIMLRHKLITLCVPVVVMAMGGAVWLGFNTIFSWVPAPIKSSSVYTSLADTFPGLGKEFMPALDEGSYLYMPTTMSHASIGEVMDVLRMQDMAFAQVPEIKSAVGKLGRAETPLDPAPISMIETVINYYPEYLIDKAGNRIQYKFDFNQQELFKDEHGKVLPALDGKPYKVQGKYLRDSDGKLIADADGMPFRLWRPALDPKLNPGRKAWKGIVKPDDIWGEIVKAGQVPGVTSAPKLQPIAARIVMLQSGMRAPMGVKVKGPDLATIEKVGLQIEKYLKEIPSVESDAVFADRIVGKPYLEIDIDRDAIARYGMSIRAVQDVIEVAIGGRQITTTVEGRERYPVRVRYFRELRDSIEALDKILVASSSGQQIPLSQLTKTKYIRGPQVIKSEDTALIGYVLLDKKPGYAEVDVVEQAQAYLQQKIDDGEFELPAGVSYTFAGNYENQIRAKKTMMVVLPVALFLIFMILYFQFKSIPTTMLVFSSIAIAWAGGFVLIWMYGQPWFMDFSLFGANMRDLFQVHEINLSIAIWVGFLVLFGIASDNGVIISTYLDQSFATHDISSIEKIRETTILGAERRIRPCLTTSATTILALLPILTSAGRGSDIMVPMAIPSFGGMLVVLVSAFIVPLLYCSLAELRFKWKK